MLGGEEHLKCLSVLEVKLRHAVQHSFFPGYILHKDNTCLQEININEREWIKAQYLQESTTYISYSPVVPMLLA